jgi:hypothetical protein
MDVGLQLNTLDAKPNQHLLIQNPRNNLLLQWTDATDYMECIQSVSKVLERSALMDHQFVSLNLTELVQELNQVWKVDHTVVALNQLAYMDVYPMTRRHQHTNLFHKLHRVPQKAQKPKVLLCFCHHHMKRMPLAHRLQQSAAMNLLQQMIILHHAHRLHQRKLNQWKPILHHAPRHLNRNMRKLTQTNTQRLILHHPPDSVPVHKPGSSLLQYSVSADSCTQPIELAELANRQLIQTLNFASQRQWNSKFSFITNVSP